LVFSVSKRHFLLHFFYKRCQAGTQGSGSKNAGQCHKTKLRSEKKIVSYKTSAKIPHNFFTSRHIATGIRSFLLKIFWLNPAAAEKEKRKKLELQIRDVYTGSRIQIFPYRILIRASKNISIFDPEHCF
jgi:hypothetical protein